MARRDIRASHAQLPFSREPLEERVCGSLADPVSAQAAQHEKLGDVHHVGRTADTRPTLDEREAAELPVGSDEERRAALGRPPLVGDRNVEATVRLELERYMFAEVVRVELEQGL